MHDLRQVAQDNFNETYNNDAKNSSFLTSSCLQSLLKFCRIKKPTLDCNFQIMSL